MGVTIAGEGHGVAHCFRCGLVETRRNDRELTPAEREAFKRRMDALRRQHDVEQRERQAETAEAAARRWAAAEPVTEHTYLTNKGVQAYGIRIEGGHTLLVPMRDTEGRLWSLQSIAPDGEKRFMPGGRVKGCYCSIGRPSGRLVVCEGYATGATIHEDTGLAVAVAFNAGNLLPVAKALRAKFPCVTLVIAGDDDWKTEGNPGLKAATEAAQAVGGLLAMPNFDGLPRKDTDTDMNDLHRLAGKVEVQA
ncbi:DNA primase TraC [Xylophilus ampelinus]|nr:DNA primase TraC [Xylophilus ampelinus]